MDVLQGVKKILTSELLVEVPAEKMQPEDGLRDQYGLDSVGFVELRVQCEEQFDVMIGDDDFQHFETLGGVVTLIERLRRNGAGA